MKELEKISGSIKDCRRIIMAWSESIKNKTRECVGDGAMVKNEHWKFGFYSSDGNGVRIIGVKSGLGFPVPSGEVIATFSDREAMIDAGWVID